MKDAEKYPWIGREDRRGTLLLLLTVLFWIINLALVPLWTPIVKDASQMDRSCFGLLFFLWPFGLVKFIEHEFLPRPWSICTDSGSPVRCTVYPDGRIVYDVVDTLKAYSNRLEREKQEKTSWRNTLS